MLPLFLSPYLPPSRYPRLHVHFPSQLSGCYWGREGEGGHEERGSVCVIPDTVRRGDRKRGSVCVILDTVREGDRKRGSVCVIPDTVRGA